MHALNHKDISLTVDPFKTLLIATYSTKQEQVFVQFENFLYDFKSTLSPIFLNHHFNFNNEFSDDQSHSQRLSLN